MSCYGSTVQSGQKAPRWEKDHTSLLGYFSQQQMILLICFSADLVGTLVFQVESPKRPCATSFPPSQI